MPTPAAPSSFGIVTHRLIAAAVIALLPSACTWVKVNEAGAAVAVRAPTEVLNCKTIGLVSGTTVAKVIIRRNARKIQEEVTALGKNEAAKIGGNAIVAKGPLTAGAQEFDVYRCP